MGMALLGAGSRREHVSSGEQAFAAQDHERSGVPKQNALLASPFKFLSARAQWMGGPAQAAGPLVARF